MYPPSAAAPRLVEGMRGLADDRQRTSFASARSARQRIFHREIILPHMRPGAIEGTRCG